jgi:polysaccharide export outer membrane protein
MRIAFGTVAAAFLATAVGCAHGGATKEEEAQPVREYRIAREDVIEVSVWKEPELSRTLPVRPDGKITLPLVGDVEAEGHTPAELESAVQKKLTPRSPRDGAGARHQREPRLRDRNGDPPGRLPAA